MTKLTIDVSLKAPTREKLSAAWECIRAAQELLRHAASGHPVHYRKLHETAHELSSIQDFLRMDAHEGLEK